MLIIRKKYILVLGKGPTQGLESTLTAEKMYSINFTVTKKIFCLSFHYNAWLFICIHSNVWLFMLIFNKLWLYIFIIYLKRTKRLYQFKVYSIIKLYICLHDTFLELKIVKNGYCGNGVLFFAWDLGVIFLSIQIFWDLRFRKKIFFF